jgi:hypothetical protein
LYMTAKMGSSMTGAQGKNGRQRWKANLMGPKWDQQHVEPSQIGNHNKITIKGNTAVAGLKFFAFLGLFGSKIAPSPVTETKIVHSQARVTRHLNLWSKRYSK